MNIKVSSGLAKELMKAVSRKFNVPVYQGTAYCRNRLKNGFACKECESEKGCNLFRTILARSIFMRIAIEKIKQEIKEKFSA